MAKSPPVRTKPAPSARPAEERTGPSLPALRVIYYRRMKRQHVYAVTVGWHNPEERRPPANAGPVVLRLLMAGAQVVPAEQPLDPTKPDVKATFFVTPLAGGWLRNERLEVLVDGRKVQEMPLPAKVASQRRTGILMALAIMVPWLLLSYGKYSPLQENKALAGKLKTPGQVLENRITENVPSLPDFVKDNVPSIQDGLVNLRTKIGEFYDLLWVESQKTPLAFYAGAGLWFLTLASWFIHREKRKKRLGKPIPLPHAEPTAATLRRSQPAEVEVDFE